MVFFLYGSLLVISQPRVILALIKPESVGLFRTIFPGTNLSGLITLPTKPEGKIFEVIINILVNFYDQYLTKTWDKTAMCLSNSHNFVILV